MRRVTHRAAERNVVRDLDLNFMVELPYITADRGYPVRKRLVCMPVAEAHDLLYMLLVDGGESHDSEAHLVVAIAT